MENNFKDFDTTPTLTLDPFQTAEEKQEPAVVEEKKEEVIAEENILSEEERQMAEKFAVWSRHTEEDGRFFGKCTGKCEDKRSWRSRQFVERCSKGTEIF